MTSEVIDIILSNLKLVKTFRKVKKCIYIIMALFWPRITSNGLKWPRLTSVVSMKIKATCSL